MKILVEDYSFNKATKQITFTGFSAIELSRLLLITNVSSNVIVYSFADAAKGGSVAGNVLTLDYDTSTMNNADKLQIFMDDGSLPANEANQVLLSSLIDTLQELGSRLAPLAGAMAPNATLRVTGVVMPSIAVSGPITSAQSIAEKNLAGVAYTQRLAIENQTATHANINNVTP